jgi:prepilin-type processing-associated H-X9-DG protein
LSWRVLILPYLDAKDLYDEFHLDEPWDSPHNRALITKMPATYRCPIGANELALEGKTRYLAPRGAGTIFRGAEPVKIREVTDGTATTIIVVDAGDDNAVVWTKPDDWEVDPEPKTAAILKSHTGRRPGSGTNALFADGSVHFLSERIALAVFRALLTSKGGEVIESGDLR